MVATTFTAAVGWFAWKHRRGVLTDKVWQEIVAKGNANGHNTRSS
jgi:hypothetical protein